jgi:hypothetical protein
MQDVDVAKEDSGLYEPLRKLILTVIRDYGWML